MGLVPDLPTWKFVLFVIGYVLYRAPVHAWRILSREYNIICKKFKRLKAKVPLTPGQEFARAAREELNKQHDFMKLPGEIRNRIYELTMLTDVVIESKARTFYGYATALPTIYDTEQTLLHDMPDLEGDDPSFQYPRSLYRALGTLDGGYATRHAKMLNLTQVSRVWRGEALRHFYGRNMFKLRLGHQFDCDGRGWSSGQKMRGLWTLWLERRPREALQVITLVWDFQHRCTHQMIQMGWCGSDTIDTDVRSLCVDFRRGQVSTSRLIPPKSGVLDCQLCLNRLAVSLEALNEDITVGKMFAELQDEPRIGEAAIKLVDRVNVRLTTGIRGQELTIEKRSW